MTVDYGVSTFLFNKYVPVNKHKEIVKEFRTKYGKWPQDDFNKFATYVDQGIRKGEIKGLPVKLLTDATKEQIENNKQYKFYANRTSPVIKYLYKVAKENKVKSKKHDSYSNIKQLLEKYFRKRGLQFQEYKMEEGDNIPKYHELSNWFQHILDNNLKEDFILFCSGHFNS